jgi:flagellar biosynthetic protein FlhB
MSEDRDDSQKTEEPTQRRLDDAREQGDIVKSGEVTTFMTLAGGALVIAALGHGAAQNFAGYFRVFLEQPDQFVINSDSIMELMRHILMGLGFVLAAPLALMTGAGLAGHLLQNRPNFAAERIKPDLSKISPMKGFKRMFGLDGLTNLVKGLIKMAIVGAAVWTTLWPERGAITSVFDLSPDQIAGEMIHLLMKVILATLAVLAVMAALDYFLQRYQFLKRNRMSRQDIKDEFRQSEGDPAVKAKIRQIRTERARRRMMAAVPKATVVIMNPTHFAIALKYEAGKTPAPVCVAKGTDALALRIRDVAKENSVPVIENPPLARALYAAIDIDEAVPPEHYKAVAQVISYVMRLSGKLRPN